MKLPDLKNKSAIVIGSDSNISRTIAGQLNSLGAKVFLSNIEMDNQNEMIDSLSKEEDFFIVLMRDLS